MAQGLYSEIEITPELEEEYIEKVAQKIHEYEMETAAILFLESSKPLVWVGGEMGRFFITPFVPILSDKWGETSEKFFRVFEKRENIEKLMNRLEQLAQEDEEKKQREKEERKTAKEAEAATEGEHPTEKRGWRKYLPF